MKTYKFTADKIIEAKNEEEAKNLFADNSFDFAADAEIEQVCSKHFEPFVGGKKCKMGCCEHDKGCGVDFCIDDVPF